MKPAMKLVALATGLALAAGLAGCGGGGGGGGTSSSSTSTGTVSGVLLSTATGQAISGATVTASGQSATTSSTGAFTLYNVAYGSETLEFAAGGLTDSDTITLSSPTDNIGSFSSSKLEPGVPGTPPI